SLVARSTARRSASSAAASSLPRSSGSRPVRVHTHPQAASAEHMWQRDRVAVEAIEYEQSFVAQPAAPEGFQRHVVADWPRAARQDVATAPAQAQGDSADPAKG